MHTKIPQTIEISKAVGAILNNIACSKNVMPLEGSTQMQSNHTPRRSFYLDPSMDCQLSLCTTGACAIRFSTARSSLPAFPVLQNDSSHHMLSLLLIIAFDVIKTFGEFQKGRISYHKTAKIGQMGENSKNT